MTIIPEDFFEELYSKSLLKYITIGIYFIGIIVGLTSEVGIIWYEKHGNHRYRTVINQLFATLSWIMIFYILLVFIPEGIRYIAGPLDSTICDIHNFLKNWICACLLLAFDCVIVLRYIFIFKLKNFAVINDDFIARVLQISICLMGFWISAANRLSVGKMSLNYYLCTGGNPVAKNVSIETGMENGTHDTSKNLRNTSDIEPRKLDTTSMVGFMSFILHVIILTKIFLFQKNVEDKTKNIRIQVGIEQSEPNTMESNKRGKRLSLSIPKSLADLQSLVGCLAFLTFYSSILITMNHFIEPAKLNTYKYRWIVYWNQILGVSISIIAITGSYYIRNKSIMTAIWRNFKN